jgi:uroporphyrinogen decarboxylase
MLVIMQLWDRWSRPYIERIIRKVKKEHPRVPITVYANGSGGLLERLGQTGADVVGLDWTVDMADARRRLGPDLAVQVCTQTAIGGLSVNVRDICMSRVF